MEIQSSNDQLLESSNFKMFLKGRKEQAMRQIFYHDSFIKQVSIAEDDINRNYSLAGRTCKVNYYQSSRYFNNKKGNRIGGKECFLRFNIYKPLGR